MWEETAFGGSASAAADVDAAAAEPRTVRVLGGAELVLNLPQRCSPDAGLKSMSICHWRACCEPARGLFGKPLAV